MSKTPDALILLPRLRVEGANAVSGPLTWGFPAPSAFTGFVHALHRRLGNDEVRLDGIGIVCHQFEPQLYQPSPFTRRFRLARHPMDKDGSPPGTVEEGRAHLTVSLLIGVHLDPEMEFDEADGKQLAAAVEHAAQGMRLAGGTIRTGQRRASFHELGDFQANREAAFRTLRYRLLPGFALRHRPDLLADHLAQLRATRPEASALDALLELVRLNVEPVADDPERPEQVTWRAARLRPGWLAPLPVGYAALSPLHPAGAVRGARDDATPFRFVETLYSLGEWVSPHRLHHPDDLLWYHRADPDAGTYLCTQPDASA
jgi:CRISPR-associated protein Csy2